jgi:thioester reductase-like protein
MATDRVFFVTGYPGFIGRRLVARVLEKHPDARVRLLVQPKFEEHARTFLAALGESAAARASILTGDIVDMHLGLSSREYQQLTAEVTDVFHLAALQYLGAEPRTMRRINVEGTRNMLEMAQDMKHISRFNHMSTCYVSGDRMGVVEEEDLWLGQRFRNLYEQSKFEGEVLVRRAMADLPVSVYRPCAVLGDSKTGEIDRFEGPYYLAFLVVMSPVAVPLPLPGDGRAPLNAVPVDYAVEAITSIADNPRGIGRTLHIVDPHPMSARRVYEMIAERTGRRLPRVSLSYKLADTVMGLPLLERLFRQERQALAYVNHLAIYNCRNTLELLDGTGIRCPPLQSYLDNLIGYVREHYRKRQGVAPAEPERAPPPPPAAAPEAAAPPAPPAARPETPEPARTVAPAEVHPAPKPTPSKPPAASAEPEDAEVVEPAKPTAA